MVLLHEGMQPIPQGERVDILLPPQYYTMRKEHIEVRYSYQAKRLAASILESFLEEGVEYDYFVYKEEQDWIFIAYSPEEISLLLERKNIDTDQVSKLYFAEQSKKQFELPVLLNEREAVVTLDKSVTVVPRELLASTQRYQRFDDSFAPQSGVSFGVGVGSLFTRKDTIIIATLLTLFTFVIFFEALRYRSVAQSMEREIGALFVEYPTLQSGYARKNILTKYKKIDTQERKKRELLKSISHFVSPTVVVEHLILDKKRLAVLLKCQGSNSMRKVELLAKAKKYKVTKVGNDKLKIESRL